MREDDLAAVLEVANAVHPALPESRNIFAERLSLFPQGCLVLTDRNEVAGYAVSHPIRRFEIPALNTLLGGLHAGADDFYIHDVAVMPRSRGSGYAKAAINQLLGIADGYETASLVSVYGTADFWRSFGFLPAGNDMGDKLKPYGAGAVYMLRRN